MGQAVNKQGGGKTMQIIRKVPAKRWGEAFSLGNGQLGGMVYGGTETERVDLSENTFFSGNASLDNNAGRGVQRGFCSSP